MRATLMFETGWCGFGMRLNGGLVLCLGALRVTACLGRIGDRMQGYDASLSAAHAEMNPEQKARKAGL